MEIKHLYRISIRPTKHIGGPLFVVIRLAHIIHVDLAAVKVYAVMSIIDLVALFAQTKGKT